LLLLPDKGLLMPVVLRPTVRVVEVLWFFETHVFLIQTNINSLRLISNMCTGSGSMTGGFEF